MKKRYFNKIKTAFFVIIGVTMISACVNDDSFFELQDRGGIDAAIWSTEGAVQLHLNRAYEVIIPDFGSTSISATYMHARAGIHYASDENLLPLEDDYALAALGLGGETINTNSVFYAGDKYSGNKGENKYFDIARCNDAIKNIPTGTMPKATQRIFLGQYYALRAMVYFGLVKVYGGVPLVLEPQSPDNITVDGRASAKECFASIVSDLDSSIVMLKGVKWADATDRGKIDQSAAAALKAKVLLYWASPQFNPLNDGKHTYDPSRWTAALTASEEAMAICKAAGHKLLDNYADIFIKEGTDNPEAIIVRPYSSTIAKRGQNIELLTRPASEGGSALDRYRASTRLLDAYPMKDGNPINKPNKYTYDDVVFWVNRDPRLNATIAYNGSYWALNGKGATRRQWAYTGAKNESSASKGVFCKRFTLPSLTTATYNSDIGGGNGMDWIELRFAEVMLNYAECANEKGDMFTAKDMVRQIRQRAGIEYVDAANDYGLGAVNSISDMRELIFNERFVEFAFEEKRNSDLRRMRRMHLLSGSLMTIGIDPKDAAAKTALETAHSSGVLFRESLNLNDKNTYLQYFQPPYFVSPINRTFNIPDYHIFYTFNTDFVLSGKNIQTTIGWPGGTFDPLD